MQFPGVSNAWTMPIKARLDMLATGIRTPIGVKIFGRDLTQIEGLARQVETVLKNVPGTSSAYAERIIGGYYLDVVPDRAALARYGLMIGDVQEVIATALGGETVTTTVEGTRTLWRQYPLSPRLPLIDPRRSPMTCSFRCQAAGRRRLARSPRSNWCEGRRRSAPRTASSRLTSIVDVRDRDIGGYVAEARQAVADQVKFPAGYYVAWSGQFEYMERAAARMRIVVPVTLLVIFLLLYLNFRRLTETLIVMASLPFALVGGVWLMWHLGFNMSVAVAVGFIALAGVAAETGVVMLIYLDHAMKEVMAERAGEGQAFHPRRPAQGDHARRGRARAAENDDGRRHHGRSPADPVEHRRGLRSDAAHRRADDRRHGVLDVADPHRHSGDLRSGQGIRPAARRRGARLAGETRRRRP